MPPRRYTIDVSDAVLDDLRERLARTRWPEPLPGDPWEHGADVAYIRRALRLLARRVRLARAGAALNAYPQFVSTIDGLDFHYWHVRGTGPIADAARPRARLARLDLRVPPPHRSAHRSRCARRRPRRCLRRRHPGAARLRLQRQADRSPAGARRAPRAPSITLMTEELGYDRYGTQGGDWGCVVTSLMAAQPRRARHRRAPQHALRRADARAGRSARSEGIPRGRGRVPARRDRLQPDSTARSRCRSASRRATRRPASPPGSSRSSAPGATATATSRASTRRTSCSRTSCSTGRPTASPAPPTCTTSRAANAAAAGSRSRCPSASPCSRKSSPAAPRSWVEGRLNITHWTEMPRGGHFAAIEQPALLLEDIRAFFRTLR